MSNRTIHKLNDNLCLFFTKFSRRADQILKKQNQETKKNNKELIKNLEYNKNLGLRSKKLLEKGRLEDFADILNEQWLCKIQRSPNN